jgi:hypothetical protein
VIDRPEGRFPIAGGCNDLRALCGTWRGWWDVGDELDADGIEWCNFGSRTLRLNELSADGTLRVDSVVVTGQGPAVEHPGSPHSLDQLELFGESRMKRLPVTRDEVAAASQEEDHSKCNHSAHETLVRAAR